MQIFIIIGERDKVVPKHLYIAKNATFVLKKCLFSSDLMETLTVGKKLGPTNFYENHRRK